MEADIAASLRLKPPDKVAGRIYTVPILFLIFLIKNKITYRYCITFRCFKFKLEIKPGISGKIMLEKHGKTRRYAAFIGEGVQGNSINKFVVEEYYELQECLRKKDKIRYVNNNNL